MKYVFGPVPSRRLGKSLGIDPILLKTCNWNCVYCQLGRTRPLTNLRSEYIPRQEILAEAQQALSTHQPGEIDWVTFVGSGEPTLHAGLGWLISAVKQVSRLPVAVITNGALLYLPEVRAGLLAADAVLPSLDAGTPSLYRKINRPHPQVTFERLVEGLAAFRQEYTRQLWVEVMLVKGLNDTCDALQAIARVLERIQPDQVHLLTPVRPPAESWVEPCDADGMLRAQEILGAVACVKVPESIPAPDMMVSAADDLSAAILGMITRHPMRADELDGMLKRWDSDKIQQALNSLLLTGKAQRIKRYGQTFWSAVESFYEGQ